jgi:hypothetical protein
MKNEIPDYHGYESISREEMWARVDDLENKIIDAFVLGTGNSEYELSRWHEEQADLWKELSTGKWKKFYEKIAS